MRRRILPFVLVGMLGACTGPVSEGETTVPVPDAPTAAAPPTSTSTVATTAARTDERRLTRPLDELLVTRDVYADILFLTYVDTFWHPNNHRGERAAVAAQADVNYEQPPEIPAGAFPSPCVPEDSIAEMRATYIGQPFPNAAPNMPPAFITVQAIGLASSTADAAAVVDAASTCEQPGALWPDHEDAALAEKAVELGADAAAAFGNGADPSIVGEVAIRNVTFHVGPVVGFLAMRGLSVPDIDVIELYAEELVTNVRISVTGPEAETDEEAAPLAEMVVYLLGNERLIAVGGGQPDRVLLGSTDERALGATPPAVAPDGETIAFIWTPPDDDGGVLDRQEHLSIRQPDGTIVDVVSASEITTPRGRTEMQAIGDPVWNVDGTLLAFEWDEPSWWGEVWTVRSDGTELQLATPPSGGEWYDKDEAPFWGSDPDELYVDSARTRRGAIWRASPDGSVLTQVTADIEDSQISNGTVSPDGRWLVAVNLLNSFLITDLETGAFTLLEPGPEINDSTYGRPQWSPDGTMVAYAADRDRLAFLVDPARGSVERVGLPPGGRTLLWTPDGSGLITRFNDEVTEGLALVDVATGDTTVFRDDLVGVSIVQPTYPRS